MGTVGTVIARVIIVHSFTVKCMTLYSKEFASTNHVAWLESHDVHLCWSEEANGIEMLHGLSAMVANKLKKVDLLLQDLRLWVHHTDYTNLLCVGGGGGE